MATQNSVPVREIGYSGAMTLIRGLQLHRQDPPDIPEGLPPNVTQYAWGGVSIWVDRENRRGWMSSTRWSRLPTLGR